jgi:hypothetical protein
VIILLIFIVAAVAVPVAVEVVRSPEVNLVRETKNEVSEFIVAPLQSWVKDAVNSLSDLYEEKVRMSLGGAVVRMSLIDLIRSLSRQLVQWIRSLFQ